MASTVSDETDPNPDVTDLTITPYPGPFISVAGRSFTEWQRHLPLMQARAAGKTHAAYFTHGPGHSVAGPPALQHGSKT